ncbi:MAG: hypothetical protein JWM52_106 [Candidatus Saccharibacteria bacterium]|nr:hypothetical protein [Candidatus Saccharibacteria bacterium]
MVEQEAVNFEVAGSSPAVGAKNSFHDKKPSYRMAFCIPTSVGHHLTVSSKVLN